jgi:hypothetical protein
MGHAMADIFVGINLGRFEEGKRGGSYLNGVARGKILVHAAN